VFTAGNPGFCLGGGRRGGGGGVGEGYVCEAGEENYPSVKEMLVYRPFV
jgi:hypothetical protein